VLARVHALAGDPRVGRTNQRLWELAAEVVAAAAVRPKFRLPSGSPLVFAGNCSVANQALMELGATVCTVASPGCPACPLAAACRAFAGGQPARFPEIPARAPTVARRFATVLWHHRGRWLVRKRPSTGHNPDLWELPNLEIGADTDPGAALARWLGVPGSALVSAGKLKRTVTNNRIVEELFRLDAAPRADLPAAGLRWTTDSELRGLPMVARHRALTES
jgi:A/G-specific adenine glycosylase